MLESLYICPKCLETCGMCGHRECDGLEAQPGDVVFEALRNAYLNLGYSEEEIDGDLYEEIDWL